MEKKMNIVGQIKRMIIAGLPKSDEERDFEYEELQDEAEKRINEMSHMELLTLIELALQDPYK